MASGLRSAVVFAVIVAAAFAQDISKLSSLYFPDGGMPSIHPEPSRTHLARREDKKVSQTDSVWRLPKDIIPYRYYLSIEIDPEQQTFSGEVKIIFKCQKATRKVTLHGADLEIVKYSKIVDYYDEKKGYESTLKKDLEHQTLTFTAETDLTQSLVYAITIEFKGRFWHDYNGLYRSNYTRNGETRHLAVTHFEPYRARQMYPCFDEPDLKAYFHVQVRHPTKYSALSNAPLKEKKKVDSTWSLSTFEPTVLMSSYLLAIVVSDYKSVGTDIARVWAREDVIYAAKLSQDVAARAIQRLENYTSIKFPMKKIDHVAIPHFGAGAMENFGLITYKEPYLVLEPNVTKTPTKVYTVTVVAHELTHQWFGDLVTMKWWSATWLNEGFATFFAFNLPGEDPKWRLKEQFIPLKYQYGMEVDQDPYTSIPMTSDVETPPEISDKFDQISYSKGASVLRMFNELLGEKVFQEAIREYLTDRSFRNAEPVHLFSQLAKVSKKSKNQLPEGLDWEKLGRVWTEQAGLPLVKAVRNYGSGEVRLTQSRFCLKDCEDEDRVGRWWIPITWTTQGEGFQEGGLFVYQPQLWLSGEDSRDTKFMTKTKPHQWILINPKSIGYYRVTYDDQNWELLAKDLLKNTKSFPTENRAQVLHDAVYLSLAGNLSFPVTLNVSLFLQNEDDFVVWMSGVKLLRETYDVIGASFAYDVFCEYAQKLLGKAFAKVGLEAPANGAEDIGNSLLRAYVAPYACMFGDAKCLKEAKPLLEKLLSGTSVHPDVETPVACGGVRGGDAALFWKVRAKAIDHRDPNMRAVLLSALACSKDDKLIKEHLTKTITEDNFPKGRIYNAFVSVLKSLPKFNVAFDVIRKNFQKIIELLGTETASTLAKEVVVQVHTRTQYDMVVQWLPSLDGKVNNFRQLKTLLKTSSATAEKNAQFYSALAPWLYTFSGRPEPTTERPRTSRRPGTSHAATITPESSLLSILLLSVIVKLLQQ